MIISVSNDLADLNTSQYTYLSTNVTAGGTTLPVKNINSFNESWAIQLGKTGESKSEILIISGTPSGTVLNTTGTLRFDHSLDTPVIQIHYNSIIFERSTSGTSGTATAIGTQAITPNSLFTEYNDASGSSSYAYKTKYYNTQSSDVTVESDWFVPNGPTFYSLQSMRQRMKDALHSANFLKSDEVISDWINEWLEIMNNSAIKVNQGYSMGTTSVSFGTSGLGTVTLSDFKQINKLEVTFDSGATYALSHEIPYNRFSDVETFSSVYPVHYWLGDNVFGILPKGNAGTARIAYSKLATRLIDDADELPLSLRSYTTSCVEYCLYKAFDNDLKRDFADDHYSKFKQQQSDFIAEITPRDQTGIKTITFSDTLYGGQDTIDIISDFIV